MIGVDVRKWGQTAEDLRRLAVESPHERTRERFMALFMIAGRAASASSWARQTGREDETVINWVRLYNEGGPEAVAYRRTGGRAPLLRPSRPGESPRRSAPRSRPVTACPATAGP